MKLADYPKASVIDTVDGDIFECGSIASLEILDAFDEHYRTGLPVTRRSDGAVLKERNWGVS